MHMVATSGRACKGLTHWAKAGVREKVFVGLIEGRDSKYLMLDTRLVRAHQRLQPVKGPSISLWSVAEAN
jgi:hypothetical protein